MKTQNESTDQWAIVELFGHQRIAGKISEHNFGGAFLRVEVPAVNGRPEFTKLYGQNAIYSITFVDRDVALAAADKLAVVPVHPYDIGAVTTEAVRNRLAFSQMQDHAEDDEAPF